MDYSFRPTLKDGYLHVRIDGDNDAPTTRRYVDDILRVCAAENCPNILVEENLEGPRFSITELFTLLTEKLEALRPALRLVAFVDISPLRSEVNQQFGETLAVNRGLSVRSFRTVEEAETWMKAQIAEIRR